MAYNPLIDLRQRTKRPPAKLESGDRSWWVRWLRRALQKHGFMEADYPVDDYFDIHTRDCLQAFQVLRQIVGDGVLGPVSLSHLAVPSARLVAPNNDLQWVSTRDDIGYETYRRGLEEAFKGAREIGGNNKGVWVQKYMGQEGLPWCVAFATWCYRTACGFIATPRKYDETWSSSRLWQEARDKGLNWICQYPAQAETGDFVLVRGGTTGHKHTAIFSHTSNGDVWVVEGNARGGEWMKPHYRVPFTRDAVRIGKYPARAVDIVKLRPLGDGS